MRRRALCAASALTSDKEVVEIWIEKKSTGRLTIACASVPVASNLIVFGDDGKDYWITEGSTSSSGNMGGSTTIYGITLHSVSDSIEDAKPQIEDDVYIYKAVNK